MLISPDYLEQNRELHKDQSYGRSSWKWADMVSSLKEEIDAKTVLDYGCGKGFLGEILGHPDWLREYDPAIPGKETAPLTVSDLVVCTDVLEHIEPDLLDSVLEHINQCARSLVFIVISVIPATKNLPDGRNAHVSLHDADWWKKKLGEKFAIKTWNDQGTEIVMVGSSVREIGDNLIAKSAVSDTLRYEQAVINSAKTKERVPGTAKAHAGRCVLVCYGPSLHYTWHNIRAERRLYGAKIVSVSGAHDFLIEKGIIPDIHIDVDPREHKGFFTRNPHPEVNYWMASCCHPKTIDNLLSNKLSLWHVYNSQEDMKIIAPDGIEPGGYLISGGGSVGCRAMSVMFDQGYRSFSVYGMDCSFANDGKQHAGEHSGKQQNEWPVRIGDRWFKSSGTLVFVAKGFMYVVRALNQVARYNGDPFIEGTNDRLELFLHGDGLLQEMYRANMEPIYRAA